MLRYERQLLAEIDAWLSDQATPVQDTAILSLARDTANLLVGSLSDAGEDSSPLSRPYCSTEAVLSVLAHRRRQGDPLLCLGQNMVLSVLSK